MQLQTVLATFILFTAGCGSAMAAGPSRLRCDFGDGAPRVFRIAPGVLQERDPHTGDFGANLCSSFRCSSDGKGVSGSIESASVIFKVQLDASGKTGSWRSLGATGRKRTSGPCTVEPDSGAVSSR